MRGGAIVGIIGLGGQHPSWMAVCRSAWTVGYSVDLAPDRGVGDAVRAGMKYLWTYMAPLAWRRLVEEVGVQLYDDCRYHRQIDLESLEATLCAYTCHGKDGADVVYAYW